MLLYVLLFQYVVCESCDDKTTVYLSRFKTGSGNQNYFYFDPDTYNYSLETTTNEKFRRLMKNNVKCTGKWCVDGEWKCKLGNNRDCYNVEHIIPQANQITDIQGCSLDIVGNLVMAYGAWNQELSNSYYGEKVIVYGSTIVKSAYISIYKACHKINPSIFPAELCLSSYNYTKYLVFILLFFGFVVVGIIAWVTRPCNRKEIERDDEL
jgi:hypothetical protein